MLSTIILYSVVVKCQEFGNIFYKYRGIDLEAQKFVNIQYLQKNKGIAHIKATGDFDNA